MDQNLGQLAAWFCHQHRSPPPQQTVDIQVRTHCNIPCSSFTCYINKCTNDIFPTVTVRTYPNQNPWITGNIHTELKARAGTFKEWDTNPDAYKKSRHDLRGAIKQVTRQYRTQGESYFAGFDTRQMWQGVQTIMDYKEKPSHKQPSDTSLPEELNAFYAHFKASNTEPCMRTSAVKDDCVI
jgi:hypothetical protein